MNMPGWLKGSLVLVVTLAAGILVGSSIGSAHPAADDMSAAHAMGDARGHLESHLRTALSLDSAQEREVRAILTRHQATVDSVWRMLQPHLRATLHESLREVAAILRPDQLETFRRMIATRHPGVLP